MYGEWDFGEVVVKRCGVHCPGGGGGGRQDGGSGGKGGREGGGDVETWGHDREEEDI